MTKRKYEHTEAREPSEGEHGTYSLWTAPPGSREAPIEKVPESTDLEALLSSLGLDRARVEDDEQAQAFKTPVTPDVLSQPTQG